jgi:catechol 2,3-dioxygenase-like lactoylglutathione lyase family enzyme
VQQALKWYGEWMPLKLESIDHVEVTVARAVESESLRFYDTVLGLERITKPEPLARNGGAWYRLGSVEFHVSPEDMNATGPASKRHVCYVVPDLNEAELELMRQGVEIIPDQQPIAGWARFYIRDPGGNRIEIAQRVVPARDLPPSG